MHIFIPIIWFWLQPKEYGLVSCYCVIDFFAKWKYPKMHSKCLFYLGGFCCAVIKITVISFSLLSSSFRFHLWRIITIVPTTTICNTMIVVVEQKIYKNSNKRQSHLKSLTICWLRWNNQRWFFLFCIKMFLICFQTTVGAA